MMESKKKDFPIFMGVFLISLATLILEIGITRIFSVLYEYHYAFLAISLAISGIGVGGIVYYTKLRNSKLGNRSLLIASQGFGVSVLLMIVFVVFVTKLNTVYIISFLAFIPFLFTGIFLSASFEHLAHKSGKLYAVDLFGAALGSIGVVLALKLGGIAVALFSGFLACLAAIFIVDSQMIKSPVKKRWPSIILPLVILLLLIFNVFSGFPGPIPFSSNARKEMANLIKHPLYGAQIEETRWSHFGRTDLVKNSLNDDEMILFVDGTAGAAMYKFNGSFEDARNYAVFELKDQYSGYFPISLLPSEEKRTALIIGPGGGRDILAAKLAGVDRITAVEINPDFVKLAKQYSDYNGGIFDERENISVFVDEGRSFLKRSEQKYDIIFLSIPITKTSRSPDSYSLSENFLFTVDSMTDYLEHLEDNGRVIIVVHHDLEVFKLVFLALEVFERKGKSPQEALTHIYTTGPPMFQVFVLKKSPITELEANTIHNKAMLERHYQSKSTFIPYLSQHQHRMPMREGSMLSAQMLNEVILGLSEGRYLPEEFIKSTNVDLKPNSDNNPFFYKMEKGLPEEVSILLILSSILTLLALLVKPKFEHSNPRILHRRDYLFRCLFFFIGVGFMLIEIPLIQKFTLFLGQPIYSLVTVLFSFLLGAGIGSYLSGKFNAINSIIKITLASLIIAVMVVLYLWIIPGVFDLLLGSRILIRILASVGLILPIGLFMGVPFPSGIRLIHTLQMTRQIPRMWGINGLSSVLGSVFAIALAITSGFNLSLITGAFFYFLVFSLFVSKRKLMFDKEAS